MAMKLWEANNGQKEAAAAAHPQIRLFAVKEAAADTPQTEASGSWTPCTPQSAAGFSAVAYFFGRELQQNLNVPIGLIQSAYGGSAIEGWISGEGMRTLKSSGSIKPSSLYNGMIAPLVTYGIKGVIWYQGEANVGQAPLYQKQFPAMISDWRRVWGQGAFPFLFVQLAGFSKPSAQPQNSLWAELREAQTKARMVPNTRMAVAIDIGHEVDMHPKNKQDVGHRLALIALATVYRKAVAYSGPIYESMQVEGNKIRLSFRNADSGLAVHGGQALRGFAVAGADHKFVWANASIDGESVLVWSNKVPAPAAVRYAWDDNPVCNLYNKDDLPCAPFRTE
jgi:sialate O-acetylesterase